MSTQITFKRKAMGRYEVLVDDQRLCQVRTSMNGRRWYWVVVGNKAGMDLRGCHFRTRDEAAAAVLNNR